MAATIWFYANWFKVKDSVTNHIIMKKNYVLNQITPAKYKNRLKEILSTYLLVLF